MDHVNFGTDEGFTEEGLDRLNDSLATGDTIRLPSRLDTSYSDRREGEGWEDFFCESCVVELSADAYNRLTGEVTFNDPTGWIRFAKDLLVRQLANPDSVKHESFRLWQLLAWTSPSLREAATVVLRRPLEELLHVELNTSVSSVGNYMSVIPTHITQRSSIVRALLRDDSIFTKNQIGVIFPYDTGALGPARASLAPARYETVKSLIDAARVQPVFEGKYSTRQIVDQILPTACNQPKTQGRYLDVREELRSLGIEAPDHPVIESDS